jgi:WD40 repeat protein
VYKFKRFPDRSHWGLNNLMAYCAQTFVAIVDPCSVQMITCLYGHRAMTSAVQWSSNTRTRGIERGNSTTLASGDESGVIIVWDIKKARKMYAFEEEGMFGKKAIVSLRWIFNEDNTFLLSLSTGSTLSLWSIQNRNRVWKYEFTEPVLCLSLDPFSSNSACFSCDSGWIIVINDLNTRKAPEKVEQRLKVEPTKDKNGNVTSSLRDFIYSPHGRNQMFLVSKRDITIYDMEIRQPIVGRVIRSGKSEFRRMYTVEDDPSMFYSLQEDGTVAVWEYNATTKHFESTLCDIVRGSKHGADRPGLLYGLAFSPIDRNKLCAVSADGKLWVWDFIRELNSNGTKKARWILSGILETTSSTIASIQVSPFSNELAVGTSNGTLLIYDLLNGLMTVKHDLFNLPILGVRWFTETDVLCFSSKKVSAKGYANELVAVDLLSGKHKQLRLDKKNDEAPIRAIRVSYSMKYLIVLVQDHPIEIYSLQNFALIKLLPFTNITALEWCPNRISINKRASTDNIQPSVDASNSTTSSEQDISVSKKSAKEHFYFTTADGSLHFYHIEDGKVYADTKKPKIFSYNQIFALAWKNDYLVSGDSMGNINYWEINNKRNRTFSTHRGLIRKILFSPDSNNILVHFAEGDFAIWDLEQGTKVGHSPSHIKAACIDWAPGNHPVISTNTGTIMIWDIGLTTTNSSAAFNSLLEPMASPALLPSNHVQYLRSLLENGPLININSFEIEPGLKIRRNGFGEYIPKDCRDKPLVEQVLIHTQLIEEKLLEKFKDPNISTAERCYLAAQFFGDLVSMQFWRMAKEYLISYKKKNDESIQSHGEQSIEETKHKAQIEQEKIMQSGNQEETSNSTGSPNLLISATSLDNFDPLTRKSSLPAVYDLLRDNESVLSDEMSVLKEHDQAVRANASKGTPSLFFKVAQDEAIMNQKGQAVKLLLETPQNHRDLHINYLHACVIAAANSGGDQSYFRQTVQFVASNLISLKSDRDLDFGVELLCLIDEGFKACKILQDFDKWEKAARLAKCILPEEQSRIILTRWADHLTSTGQLLKSIGIFMSLGLFKEVIDLLHKSELDDIGALFSKACLEFGFDIPMLHKKTILRVTMPTTLSSPSYSSAKDHDDYETTCRKLLYFIYQQYGTFLQKIGNEELADHYKYNLIKAEDCGIVKKEEQPSPTHEITQSLSLIDTSFDSNISPPNEPVVPPIKQDLIETSSGDLIDFTQQE